MQKGTKRVAQPSRTKVARAAAQKFVGQERASTRRIARRKAIGSHGKRAAIALLGRPATTRDVTAQEKHREETSLRDEKNEISGADMESLRHALREAGLRATQPRMLVLAELFRANGPLSHAEVGKRLASKGLDRVTVWRNLVALTEAGLLARTDVGDHTWRFERTGSTEHDGSAHPHFVCLVCKKVSCLPEDAVYLKGGTARGAVVLEVQVKGRCDECVPDRVRAGTS